jgi:hypothetical protein
MMISRFAVILLFPITLGAQTASFTNLEFLSGSSAGTEVLNLASPGQALTGNTQYSFNTINDSTGAKLTSSNGDISDFIVFGSSSAGLLGSARSGIGSLPSSSPLGSADSGRFTNQESYTGTVSSNNPGTISSSSYTLRFSSNLIVTDATFNFSSLNTAGITWEYSVIQLLDSTGTPFSSITGPGFTLGATSQYLSAGSGFTGQAGIGNYVSASTGTVIGVGTSSNSSGSNGSSDNLSNFNYAQAGLASGTQIGGIQVTTYVEDVRGTADGNSGFTSSLLDFSISGQTVPEPSSSLLVATGAILLAIRRRR